MDVIHVRTIVQSDGSLHIGGLPFSPGEEVDVTVQSQPHTEKPSAHSPLEGTVLKYVDPTAPVAEDDWHVLK